VALAFGVAACMGQVRTAASLPDPVPSEVQDALRQVYVDCLLDAAERLDDGKENPIKLTLEIEPLCNREFNDYAESLSRGFEYLGRHSVRDELQTNREPFITSVVLQERRSKIFGP